MARMNMIQAINSAMDVAMGRDPKVVVFGEDVGYFGGVFRCTAGLQKKYGKQRCFDAPISEGGILGAAVGMGVYGLRPVVEIQSPTTSTLPSTSSSRKQHACATAPPAASPRHSPCEPLAAAAFSGGRPIAKVRRRSSPTSAA